MNMPASAKTLLLFVISCFLLLTGLANYYFFNPSLSVFHWGHISTEKIVIKSIPIRLFIIGYFSDICWCTSLFLITVALKINNKLHRSGIILILLTPFLTEFGQYLAIFPGTFDWFDLLTYAIILLLFFYIYPPLIPFKMKTLKPHLYASTIAGIFIIMSLACASSKPAYRRPVKQPCVKHAPLTYSPVLVKMNISGSYTMKDLSGAQSFGYQYLIDALNNLTAYKYKLADGETPNLTLNITINTDSYQHYGAILNGYVYDGDFYYSWDNNYITAERLFDAIAKQVNWYITGGWCKNCDGPCVIN